ncbi:hypothetical protein ACC754_42500, partial [Rhizobium johnstonii]
AVSVPRTLRIALDAIDGERLPVGSKGMLAWDGEENFKATIAGEEPGLLSGSVAVNVPGPEHDEETHGHASVIADFIAAIGT